VNLLPKGMLPAMVALLVLISGISFLVFKGSSTASLPGGVVQAAPGSGFDGTLAPVTLAQYRGKVVFVTFLYAHCPDICPLIASNLRVSLNLLGKRAAGVQVIAISVDPRGDTPAAVASFLQAHEMTGRMQYLIGSPAELARTWSAWSVGSTREVGSPDLVAHTALVYGISAKGTLTTLYPDSFAPEQIAHDVPVLAAR
jgi:protein SCO1/2